MSLIRSLCIGRHLCTNQSSILHKTTIKTLNIGYVLRNLGIRFYSQDTDKPQKIYHGSLTNRMKAVKIFSLTTSLTGMAVQPVVMEQASKLGGTPAVVVMCGFVGFFTFVTPLLLHFITKKYVTEIHYDPKTEEYLATTISLFLMKKETKFKPQDVHVPDVPGMFTSFLVGKTALFVEPTMFTDTEHYVKIMGYDKPIDFKLQLTESENENKEKSTNN